MIKKILVVLIGIIGIHSVNAAELKIGDYVSMTPTSTSYTIPKTVTGYTSDQTIKPNELNLWRVIKINSNGTVEMVSQNVSSTSVYFNDLTGYLNFVGTLNTIAKQYQNSKYTTSARHIGYNGQTLTITDPSAIMNDPYRNDWGYKTEDNGGRYESLGGGDMLHLTDVNLVRNIEGSSPNKSYWLASRYYEYQGSGSYWYSLRTIDNGSISKKTIYTTMGGGDGASGMHIRPIVILKSGLTTDTGAGTSTSPYTLKEVTANPGDGDSDTDDKDDTNKDETTETVNCQIVCVDTKSDD